MTSLQWIQPYGWAFSLHGKLSRYFLHAEMNLQVLSLCECCSAADEENFNPTERKADGGFIEYLRVGGRFDANLQSLSFCV